MIFEQIVTMKIDKNTGLVLEGGGMRGVFTCGALDYLLDHQIYFPYTIGVGELGQLGLNILGSVSQKCTVTYI